MRVQEYYEMMGGDYADAFRRIGSDKSIVKFCKKFVNTKDYSEMLKALEEENYQNAFLASHSLKGMCLNLGFSELFKVCDVLCESLREGKPVIDITGLVNDVKKAYSLVVNTIESMEEI